MWTDSSDNAAIQKEGLKLGILKAKKCRRHKISTHKISTSQCKLAKKEENKHIFSFPMQ